MIDFHCHMDLYNNPMNIFREANIRGTTVLAVTTSPRAYRATREHFQNSDNVMVALGFHPELVAARINESNLFFDELKRCKFIGEIGIVGAERFRNSYTVQKELFRTIIKESEEQGGRILSIHSRKAESDVLGILDENMRKSKAVLHWFNGTQRDVKWALSLGCWFSINPKMCSTNNGKRIIKAIPLDKVLPETDAPFIQVNGKPYLPWDETIVELLADLKSLSINDMNKIISRNYSSLISSVSFNPIANE